MRAAGAQLDTVPEAPAPQAPKGWKRRDASEELADDVWRSLKCNVEPSGAVETTKFSSTPKPSLIINSA